MTQAGKPEYGAACNGCGLCCLAGQCGTSRQLFGLRRVCPALERTDTGGRCGVVENAARYVKGPFTPAVKREAAAVAIGAGIGCDAVTTDDNPLRVAIQGPILHAKKRAMVEASSVEARDCLNHMGLIYRGGIQ